MGIAAGWIRRWRLPTPCLDCGTFLCILGSQERGCQTRGEAVGDIPTEGTDKAKDKLHLTHHMDPVELHRMKHNIEKVRIPKFERQNPLLQGLSQGERRYMFSILNVYDPVPARRQLYYKHKMLCNMTLSY
ncbi:uncharacterized protein LOC143930433 [Lithobates pipiens]